MFYLGKLKINVCSAKVSATFSVRFSFCFTKQQIKMIRCNHIIFSLQIWCKIHIKSSICAKLWHEQHILVNEVTKKLHLIILIHKYIYYINLFSFFVVLALSIFRWFSLTNRFCFHFFSFLRARSLHFVLSWRYVGFFGGRYLQAMKSAHSLHFYVCFSETMELFVQSYPNYSGSFHSLLIYLSSSAVTNSLNQVRDV